MGRIRRMDEHLATLIAAGEVVVGPASVVRELVDNALDAGATAVGVEIEGGGLRLIRAADDGQGMDAEDAQLCFERHATSKLSTPGDMEAIRTLGFRGEALAAIAAVSRIRLETRPAVEAVGTFVRVIGGEVLETGAAARRVGTTLAISDLFWNTPARRGYLDSPTVEGRRVLQALTKTALAHPEVGFTLRGDGRELLSLPAVDDLLLRVRQIHGDAFTDALLPLLAERDGVTASGYITRPADAVRQPRRSAFAVNGRVFESYELRRVLSKELAAFAGQGRHPEAVVQIDLVPAEVDVNVSPDKSEVRFRQPRLVWAAVTDAVRYAYGEREAVAGFPAPALASKTIVVPPGAGLPQCGERAGSPDVATTPARHIDAPSREPLFAFGPARVSEEHPAPMPLGSASRESTHRHGIPDHPATLLQVAAAFLVCPVEDGMLVVDQHSAHERVNYERLRRRFESSSSAGDVQTLLMPDVLRVDPEQATLLDEMQPYLTRLGFELTPAGPREVWIHAVPADLGDRSPAVAVERLAEAYLAVRSTGVRASDAAEAITPLEDRLLKTLACHAAVKAGQPLSETEIRVLWRDLVDVDLACHDVHGRPAVLLLSATELARRMGRTLP